VSDREAACAPLASADPCFHEHACGPLEHPGRRVCGRDDCQARSRVASIDGNHRMGSRSGAEEHRSSALPAAIARRGDFAPTRTAFGRLLSRPSPFHPARSGAGRGGCRHRAARLQGNADERAVRRPASAKKPDVHQPEAPSITRSFASERRPLSASKPTAKHADASFTARRRERGTPARTRSARPIESRRPANRTPFDRPQRPL
jgi:hypothetical protein